MTDETSKYILDTARDGLSKIPEHIHAGIMRYIEHGTGTGSFLRAVIENRLKESFLLADDTNRPRLNDIVDFFYNHAPGNCWGSPERMRTWMERGGVRGKEKK